MNPYMHLNGQTSNVSQGTSENWGLSWEMMISEAAYKTFTVIERAVNAVFPPRS